MRTPQRWLLPLVITLAVGTPRAGAQALIDDGSFTLYIGGDRVGREQFSIRRADIGARPALLARATVTLADMRIESTLRADTTGQPIEFALEVHQGSRITTATRGEAALGRFTQRVSRAGGQAEKEVRLRPRTLVFDDQTVHQYYFAAQAAGGGPVNVLVPRRLAQDSISVSVRSAGQPVDLGNGRVPAMHLIVVNALGESTDIWVDDRGRLLRVAVPARGFVAVRDEPPV